MTSRALVPILECHHCVSGIERRRDLTPLCDTAVKYYLYGVMLPYYPCDYVKLQFDELR